MINTAILAGALARAAVVPSTLAYSDAAVRTEKVAYADLDLGRAADRRSLEQRIRAAVDRVCERGSSSSLDEFERGGHCYRIALNDGFAQMDAVIAARR